MSKAGDNNYFFNQLKASLNKMIITIRVQQRWQRCFIKWKKIIVRQGVQSSLRAKLTLGLKHIFWLWQWKWKTKTRKKRRHARFQHLHQSSFVHVREKTYLRKPFRSYWNTPPASLFTQDNVNVLWQGITFKWAKYNKGFDITFIHKAV